MTTDEAVAHGIKTTAGVVTSAALVMVGVFSIFATLQFMFLKQFGVGLAIAVLVDATIVRAVLLPATMKLLGDWNWYLPSVARVAPSLRRKRGRSRGRNGGARASRLGPPVERSPRSCGDRSISRHAIEAGVSGVHGGVHASSICGTPGTPDPPNQALSAWM